MIKEILSNLSLRSNAIPPVGFFTFDMCIDNEAYAPFPQSACSPHSVHENYSMRKAHEPPKRNVESFFSSSPKLAGGRVRTLTCKWAFIFFCQGCPSRAFFFFLRHARRKRRSGCPPFRTPKRRPGSKPRLPAPGGTTELGRARHVTPHPQPPKAPKAPKTAKPKSTRQKQGLVSLKPFRNWADDAVAGGNAANF